MRYKIVFSKKAKKDYEKVVQSQHRGKAMHLLTVLEEDPMQPPWEKLVDQENTYSRRINIQHRLVYQIIEEEKTIKIIRMWTHLEKI